MWRVFERCQRCIEVDKAFALRSDRREDPIEGATILRCDCPVEVSVDQKGGGGAKRVATATHV